MRLPMLHVIHGDHHAKVRSMRPAIEGERKFTPGAPGKEIQLVTRRPTLQLPRRNHKFLVLNVSQLAIGAPIEFLERCPRLVISGWTAKRGNPVGSHAPLVVVPVFALPLMEVDRKSVV